MTTPRNKNNDLPNGYGVEECAGIPGNFGILYLGWPSELCAVAWPSREQAVKTAWELFYDSLAAGVAVRISYSATRFRGEFAHIQEVLVDNWMEGITMRRLVLTLVEHDHNCEIALPATDVTVVPTWPAGTRVIDITRSPDEFQPWIHPFWFGIVVEPGASREVWNGHNSERYYCETNGKTSVLYDFGGHYHENSEYLRMVTPEQEVAPFRDQLALWVSEKATENYDRSHSGSNR